MVQLGLVTIKPVPAARLLLNRDERRVLRVDVGDQQRHVGVHAVRRCVGANGEPGRGQIGFHLAGRAARDGREEQPHVSARAAGGANGIRLGGHQHHVLDRGRHAAAQQPFGRVHVSLARRAIGGGQRADLEVGVIGQQLDEALAHGARRAEDTDFDFVGFHIFVSLTTDHRPPTTLQVVRHPSSVVYRPCASATTSACTPAAAASTPAPRPWSTSGVSG